MPMPTENGENPQFYRWWTVENSQNGMCAKSLQRQRILSVWTQGLLTLKIQGSVRTFTPKWKQTSDYMYTLIEIVWYLFCLLW